MELAEGFENVNVVVAIVVDLRAAVVEEVIDDRQGLDRENRGMSIGSAKASTSEKVEKGSEGRHE